MKIGYCRGGEGSEEKKGNMSDGENKLKSNPNNHEATPHAMTLSYIEYTTTAFGTTRIK